MSDVLPGDAGYVFAAYMVFLALLLVYLGILGAKFQRMSRDISVLTDQVESGRKPETTSAREAETEEPSSV